MKKLIVVFLGLILSLSLISCKKDQETNNGEDPGNTPSNPSDPSNPNQPQQPVDPNLPTYVTPEGYPFPQTNFDDGRLREPAGLKVVSNGHDVIYIGDTFTGEGYDAYVTYKELDNEGNEELPQITCYKIDSFSVDDSRVDYQTVGTYYVDFRGRYKADYQTTSAPITIKADRYESLNVEHIIGIKCAPLIQGKVGMKKEAIMADRVFIVLTENKYDDLGELITKEQMIRSGFTLNTDAVDVTKPGKYPVYVEYSRTYGETTITVQTFFVLELGA